MIVKKIRQVIKKLTLREHYISCGDDFPEKTFYIIRVDYPMAGILAIVKSTLSHIIYACEHNYIPVVDLLNSENQYLDKSNPKNIWEIYFRQPLGYGLDDIVHAKNIIISKNIQVPQKKYGIRVDALYSDEGLLKYYCQQFQKYIHFNSSTQSLIEYKFNQIIPINKKVLGVLARGTDYLDCHPKGHPVQPNPLEIIAKSVSIMQDRDYHYIFLATEDQRIYDLFKKHFNDKLLFNGQKLLQGMDGVKFISELENGKGLNQTTDVLNYLTSLYVLSKCNAFIGGCTAGTIGAYMMSSGFEYEYFWNLGIY